MSFGAAFYRWGGFYQPDSDDKPVAQRMEWVLARWKEVAHREAERRNLRYLQSKSQLSEALNAVADAYEADASVVHGAQSAETSAFTEQQEEQEQDTARVNMRPSEGNSAATAIATESVPQLMDLESEASFSEAKSAPATPRLSKKQQILARARQNARAPPFDAAKHAAEEARRREEEARREPPEAEVSSMRERLLRLVGRWS